MILIFGQQGQLAQSFQSTLPPSLEGQVVFVSSLEANFEKPNELGGFLDHYGPEIVVICAAYTKVDKAEEERLLCENLNFKAPQAIARWCVQNDALLIHFSTDYVFSGLGSEPWKEGDSKSPVNWYGETKLMGEEAIQATACRHLIFRTSWVYSEYGKNFVKTMLKIGRDKGHVSVVNDQVGAPTYAPDIAENVWPLIERYRGGERLKSGVYHMAGQGFVSWADFAREILNGIATVDSISTEEFPTPAPRPLNSRLNQSKLKEAMGIELPNWKDSLKLCLKRLKGA
jgi:dTDP-4-dehydrorhamnose reductase